MSVELLKMADNLAECSDQFKSEYRDELKSVEDATAEIGKAWSGSNLGYHAYVYYENLQARPPGAHFSAEWGLMDTLSRTRGTKGSWVEYSPEDIEAEIYNRAGNPSLHAAEKAAADLAKMVEDQRDNLVSELSAFLEISTDTFIQRLHDEAIKIKPPKAHSLANAMLPSGRLMSRDSNAVSAGLQVAPHQIVAARILEIKIPADLAYDLSRIARKAGTHLERKQKLDRREKRVGTNVFLGHGRSPLWRELKDFIVDRMHLPYEEFNRVPIAGVTNISRLSEMLDGAGCAFIILTAEDEQADGSMNARMNVIHETGLFQGRLGFTKAIVLLEEGCEMFSNIDGLGQIRFPQGNIAAAFEQVREVLERENMN